ncbi:hypothetical protein GOBAR_AA15171 [Gossypium barbadense]|uniref:Uncharacterized protein n=1 Tax=Gossypium barbadense TaxID=3634 RepID=A0A2P5XQ47_GOSBA|nr:hypothetical protein GOBAR_AA15171 [Gossypium barbadense]
MEIKDLPSAPIMVVRCGNALQKKGMLDQIMDSNLIGKVNPASLKNYGETAEKCLADTNHIPATRLTPVNPFDNSVNMNDSGISGTDDDAGDTATSAIFSP